jgi:UDP-glucose 4-epimerase
VSDVLVTGGAGFIGSHLASALLARGDSVVVADDLSTGDPSNVPLGVELIEADVSDAEALGRALDARSFDAVLHVAGQASIATSFANPERDLRVNVGGTLNVLE